MSLKWRKKVGFECDRCGDDDIEVLTTNTSEDLVYDGNKCRCLECGNEGGCMVSEEPYAYIDWDDDGWWEYKMKKEWADFLEFYKSTKCKKNPLLNRSVYSGLCMSLAAWLVVTKKEFMRYNNVTIYNTAFYKEMMGQLKDKYNQIHGTKKDDNGFFWREYEMNPRIEFIEKYMI